MTSLLRPVAWMFIIAALLIALDSAAGVGVLILLQRGIDSGLPQAIWRLSASAPCSPCAWWSKLVLLFTTNHLRRQSGGVGSTYGTLAQLRPYAASCPPLA